MGTIVGECVGFSNDEIELYTKAAINTNNKNIVSMVLKFKPWAH